jgi:hypothetical protein
MLGREHYNGTSYRGHVVKVEVLYPNIFPTVSTGEQQAGFEGKANLN